MAIPFAVNFTSPNANSNLTATGLARPGDPPGQPSMVHLAWSPISTTPENINSIELWLVDDWEEKRILTFTNPAIVSYDYPFPRAYNTSEFYLIQYVKSGSTQIAGLWGSDTILMPMNYLSLVSVKRPRTRRFIAPYWGTQDEEMTQEQTWQIPAGGKNYKEIAGSLRGRDINLSIEMADRQDGSNVTADEQYRDLQDIFDSTDIMCLRDPRGNKWFGKINGNVRTSFGKGGIRYTSSLAFRRVSHTEGM